MAVERAGTERRLAGAVTAILAALEALAAIGLIVAFFMAWFRSTDPSGGAAPPGWAGPYDYAWSDWHPDHVDAAVLLTALAPYVAVATALLRVVMRGPNTRYLLAIVFAGAVAGSVLAYGEIVSLSLPAGTTGLPVTGFWLFLGAAIVGLAASAADSAIAIRRARTVESPSD